MRQTQNVSIKSPVRFLRASAYSLAGGAIVPMGSIAYGHDVPAGDKAYLSTTTGPLPGPYMYLGAKHMVTGIDHLLFLVGVVFYLRRFLDVVKLVSLFALGHSITLIAGVLLTLRTDPVVIDAVIAGTVIYKAAENLGLLKGPWVPSEKAAVFTFGLVHGSGLATRLQQIGLSADGLVPNLLAFNVGVELGQVLALTAILLAMTYWRGRSSFAGEARIANVLLVVAGGVLLAGQIFGFAREG